MQFYWQLVLLVVRFFVAVETGLYIVDYGTVFPITPSWKNEIKNGSIHQIEQPHKKCDDSSIVYTWNGSSFLIGPAFTNYHGRYKMHLENFTGAWKMIMFDIYIRYTPYVKYRKVIVDENDTVNLTCSFQTNCNIPEAMWSKDRGENPVTDSTIKRSGNVTFMTLTVVRAEKHFSHLPYSCFINKESSIDVKLEVRERKQLSVDVSNNSTWFNRDTDGSIEFTIHGSPLPSLTCTQNRTRKIVLSCSKTQMRSLLYEEKSKPCISISGKHVLISRASQTGKVKLLITKLKLETDNGRLHCILRNPYDKNHFYLDVNVKVMSELNITKKNEQNGTTFYCNVKANPPPNIKWKICPIGKTEQCAPLVTGKTVRKKSYLYQSSIFMNKSDEEYEIKCGASNKFWTKNENDIYRVMTKKTESSFGGNEKDKAAIVAVGCSFALFLIIIFASVLYASERRKNRTYKRFFMANNQYSVDPLKSLNEQIHNLSYDEDWEFPHTYLDFQELIGCGAFGKVYKAKAYGIGLMNSRDKSTQAKKQRKEFTKARYKPNLALCDEKESITVAVKTTKENPSVNDIRNLAGELKMIIHVGEHVNIVNVLGACTKYPKLYMIIEYCPHGSLLEFLRKRREIFQPTWCKEDFSSEEIFTMTSLVSAALQICNGMQFLAAKKCIHRDLAARNVLVADNYVMKVADFGMAREIVDDMNYVSSTQGYFPVKWMALESILEKVYTEESDVWSFGILLWEMFALGKPPYPSLPIENLLVFLQNSLRMEKPENCPGDIYHVMRECWDEEPKKRPTFQSLYNKLQKILYENVVGESSIDCDDNLNTLYLREVSPLSCEKNESFENLM